MDVPHAAVYPYSMSTPHPSTPGKWTCRVCGSDQYNRVIVIRRHGGRYATNFFACAQCNVMFLNPDKFGRDAEFSTNSNLPAVVPSTSGRFIRLESREDSEAKSGLLLNRLRLCLLLFQFGGGEVFDHPKEHRKVFR